MPELRDARMGDVPPDSMPLWHISHRFDRLARPLADRHYNRRKIGSPQFVPPGRCVVLCRQDALWITSWPIAEYVRHAWPGAWICSAFRNEGPTLSSLLIREAVAATRYFWPVPPAFGLITFVNPAKVRHKRDPGRCFLRAGFRRVGESAGGLIVLQLTLEDMPTPAPCRGVTQHFAWETTLA